MEVDRDDFNFESVSLNCSTCKKEYLLPVKFMLTEIGPLKEIVKEEYLP
jgi:hypothetical protein